MAWTKFGPGTVTYTVDAGTPVSFAGEVKGGGINHAYEEVGEAITYLDGTGDPASEVRGDSVTFECDFDLSASGFYNFMWTNDTLDAAIVYTPNTAGGASWAGTVRVKLPETASADAFGAKISGTVNHQFVGNATFTPATA